MPGMPACYATAYHVILCVNLYQSASICYNLLFDCAALKSNNTHLKFDSIFWIAVSLAPLYASKWLILQITIEIDFSQMANFWYLNSELTFGFYSVFLLSRNEIYLYFYKIAKSFDKCSHWNLATLLNPAKT